MNVFCIIYLLLGDDGWERGVAEEAFSYREEGRRGWDKGCGGRGVRSNLFRDGLK